MIYKISRLDLLHLRVPRRNALAFSRSAVKEHYAERFAVSRENRIMLANGIRWVQSPSPATAVNGHEGYVTVKRQIVEAGMIQYHVSAYGIDSARPRRNRQAV